MTTARRPATRPSPPRDPVLVALFKATGQPYEQGILELAARLQASLQQAREERAPQSAGAARNKTAPFLGEEAVSSKS